LRGAERDRAGFVINAFPIPFVLSEIQMMESGFATAEDIEPCVRGCPPSGPLARGDRIGPDQQGGRAEHAV
jgi:3-hydroxyacyl-CoA dehydrogenase